MISWTKLLTGNLRPLEKSLDTRPSVVVWNVTSRCNLKCRHCYFDAAAMENEGELSKKEAAVFIDDLARYKVPALIFSGGEPLLRPDIFELAGFAAKTGIRTALSTNGTLITQEMAKRIKGAGFSYVGISLDGMEKTNDVFRQAQGAFSASLEAVRNCKKVGVKAGLRFTLTKYNLKDLPSIFNLVEKESIPRLCIYHLVYAGRGKGLKDKDLNPQEKRKALGLIWDKTLDFCHRGLNVEILTVDNHADGAWIYLKVKKENPKRASSLMRLLKMQGGNASGIRLAAVDHCGNVYPDQFWRTVVLGNIRQRSFNDIWEDRTSLFLSNLRNRGSLMKGRCQRCGFFLICNGNFRARAEAAFGNSWAEDPACYLTDKEIYPRG